MGKTPKEVDALIAAVNTLGVELGDGPLRPDEERIIRDAYAMTDEQVIAEAGGKAVVALLRKRLLASSDPNSVHN